MGYDMGIEFVLGSLLLFVAFLCVTLIFTLRERFLLFLVVPLIMSSLILLYSTYQEVISQPIHGDLPERFSFYDYRIIEMDSGQEIAVWLQEKGDTYPRTHIIPYSDETRKTLSEARRLQKKGVPIFGDRESRSENDIGTPLDRNGTRLHIPKIMDNFRSKN